jgi:hypothetical protein
MSSSDFSLIKKLGLTNKNWLSYLGFADGEIENCDVRQMIYNINLKLL